jgi:hypothetical protein
MTASALALGVAKAARRAAMLAIPTEGEAVPMANPQPQPDVEERDETPEPEVIQRVADALESTEDGDAATITLVEDASTTPSLPQRGR